jgi:hypothetical protein
MIFTMSSAPARTRALVAMLCAAASVTALVVAGPAPSASAAGLAPAGSVGVDISYPNCGSVVPAAAFGIVGVTGGAAYTVNPCLAEQAHGFRTLSLYANTGWNAVSPNVSARAPRRCAPTDTTCLAYNYGYNAGLAALAAAARAGMRSSSWWLDVELANTWGGITQNRASLQGEYDALRRHGVATVGAYSTTSQWSEITRGWKNGWPSWGATVLPSAAAARGYCTGHRFTGGPSWFIQFRPSPTGVDRDVACLVPSPPSAPRRPAVGFPRARTAVVAWLAPASAGTAPLASYRVRCSSDGGRTWTQWSNVGLRRNVTRSGLVRLHVYRVQVLAANAVGAGPVATIVFRQHR